MSFNVNIVIWQQNRLKTNKHHFNQWCWGCISCWQHLKLYITTKEAHDWCAPTGQDGATWATCSARHLAASLSTNLELRISRSTSKPLLDLVCATFLGLLLGIPTDFDYHLNFVICFRQVSAPSQLASPREDQKKAKEAKEKVFAFSNSHFWYMKWSQRLSDLISKRGENAM